MRKLFERLGSGLIVPKHQSTGRLVGFGRYRGLILRDGKVVDEWEDKNLIVNQGLDDILGVYFNSVAQTTTWYLAPFSNNYVPVGTDTATTIAANSGESTSYNGTSRQPFASVEGNQQVSNAASPASYTFNKTDTIYGAFLISSSTIGGNGGKLFSAAQFATPKNVVASDQLLLTYTFTAASG